MKFKEELDSRINSRGKRSLLDVNTILEHFSIISYKVPVKKIQHLIPRPFKLWTFNEGDSKFALISAVPFKDKDFSFYRIAKFPKFNFFQTNFRTYIIDERDQSNSAWFFGTTLGSFTSLIPKYIWKMPWEYGKYHFSFKLSNNVYSEYNMNFSSKQGKGIVNIQSSNSKMELLEGFQTIDEQLLILTHPVIGYYNLLKNKLGTYEIWHPKMELYIGKAEKLYFEIFERLGFLTKEEMNNPHSVLIAPEIEFDILMPPKKIEPAY